MNDDSKKILITVGNPNNIRDRGGSNYFFLKAAREYQFIDTGLSLNYDSLSFYKLIWNLWSLFNYREKGGFQFSSIFLNKIFNQAKLDSDQIEFISRFPLLPPLPWKKNWMVNYYIDATLKQNFEEYGLSKKVGKTIQREALNKEQQAYFLAKRIICMSHWGAKSVVEDYGIPSSKVHVICGGANLDEDSLREVLSNTNRKHEINVSMNPLKLGFIGKDWQRKGLLKLLQIAEVLQERKIQVKVLVIGPSPKELPQHPLLTSLGFVDKSKNLPYFTHLLRQFHFGCLFSTVEALGISNLECLRLGIPVIATRAGGIIDTVPNDVGFLFEPDFALNQVADLLEFFVKNPESYRALRQKVLNQSKNFAWKQTVKQFIQVWKGSQDFQYDRITQS